MLKQTKSNGLTVLEWFVEEAKETVSVHKSTRKRAHSSAKKPKKSKKRRNSLVDAKAGPKKRRSAGIQPKRRREAIIEQNECEAKSAIDALHDTIGKLQGDVDRLQAALEQVEASGASHAPVHAFAKRGLRAKLKVAQEKLEFAENSRRGAFEHANVLAELVRENRLASRDMRAADVVAYGNESVPNLRGRYVQERSLVDICDDCGGKLEIDVSLFFASCANCGVAINARSICAFRDEKRKRMGEPEGYRKPGHANKWLRLILREDVDIEPEHVQRLMAGIMETYDMSTTLRRYCIEMFPDVKRRLSDIVRTEKPCLVHCSRVPMPLLVEVALKDSCAKRILDGTSIISRDMIAHAARQLISPRLVRATIKQKNVALQAVLNNKIPAVHEIITGVKFPTLTKRQETDVKASFLDADLVFPTVLRRVNKVFRHEDETERKNFTSYPSFFRLIFKWHGLPQLVPYMPLLAGAKMKRRLALILKTLCRVLNRPFWPEDEADEEDAFVAKGFPNDFSVVNQIRNIVAHNDARAGFENLGWQ
jgi:hypothetical protein